MQKTLFLYLYKSIPFYSGKQFFLINKKFESAAEVVEYTVSLVKFIDNTSLSGGSFCLPYSAASIGFRRPIGIEANFSFNFNYDIQNTHLNILACTNLKIKISFKQGE